MKKCILLAILFIVSCKNTSLEPTLGENFEIEFGEQVFIPAENIRIQFNDVIEDSRCPKGVECVWGGNAKIAIGFNGAEIKLNTNLKPGQATISDYIIELISVDPYPIYDVNVEKEDYVVTLLVTKK